MFSFLDFFFPKVCLICSRNGSYICSRCFGNKLARIKEHRCHVCQQVMIEREDMLHDSCKGKTGLDGVVAVVEYNKLAQGIIKEFKYSFYFAMAEELGRQMKSCLGGYELRYDVVTPVPLSRKRLWWRGFNQAEKLAREIDSNISKILARAKHTKTQVGLSREGRLSNLAGIFRVKGDVTGMSVLLIDDVMTTGATLEECARALKGSGAVSVYGLVWARD